MGGFRGVEGEVDTSAVDNVEILSLSNQAQYKVFFIQNIILGVVFFSPAFEITKLNLFDFEILECFEAISMAFQEVVENT